MPAKKLKAKSSSLAPRASSSSKVARKAKVLKPEFSPEEVVSFEQQVARHQHSESAWQRLTAAPDGDDRWSEVEEHLLTRDQQQEHAERRWKYFSK